MIFLSTKQVESFDPAMKSRINLALGFQPPGIDIRRQLWIKHLSKVPAADIDLDPEEDVDEFLREKLNGREIAYAINTARTIARFEEKLLQMEHIHKVLKVKNDFENLLKSAEKKLSSIGVERQDSILKYEKAEYKS